MAAINTLEKIRRLEKYVAIQESTDTVFDLALDKLLDREVTRLQEMQEKLHGELVEFEKRYGLDSHTFYRQYEEGRLGDAIDLVEWSATVEMMNNIRQHLNLLQNAAHQ